MENIRVGHGYDSHRLLVDYPLYLGGLKIDSPVGSKAHSDGDVLLHALIDAILGATAQGDIGEWFPDQDPTLKNIRSTILLERVIHSPRIPNFKLINLDCTIFLDKPKLSVYKNLIKNSLAELLQVSDNLIGVKAKSLEGMDRPDLLCASATILIKLL